MKWLFRTRRSASGAAANPTADTELARLTARADLIVEELDIVVSQLSDMLRNAPGTTP